MLPSIKHILYASDMGENSRPAFRMAVKQAVDNNAQITFLNVIEPLSSSARSMVESYMPSGALKKIEAEGLAELQTMMSDRIAKFCEDELPVGVVLPKGEPVKRVERGVVEDVILEVAEEINADLIVMGTRTHSSLAKLFLGSSAQRVLQHSDRPVLIVPLSSQQ